MTRGVGGKSAPVHVCVLIVPVHVLVVFDPGIQVQPRPQYQFPTDHIEPAWHGDRP